MEKRSWRETLIGTCSDCHGLHKIPLLKGDEPKTVASRKEFHTEVCQKCHGDKEMMERNKVFLIATQTYYESYHGKVEHLGYPRLVAGCADCHGFHSILPPDDSKSLTSQSRLVETLENAIPMRILTSSCGFPMPRIMIRRESQCSTGSSSL